MLRFSRVVASTRLARGRSAGQTTRLRCEANLILADHDRDDFRVRRVSRIIAGRTGIATLSVASRCASSAAAIGGPAYVRRAQHDDADLTGKSSCARTAGKGRMSSMSLIAILPVNSFRPFLIEIVGCRGFLEYAALEKCAQ